MLEQATLRPQRLIGGLTSILFLCLSLPAFAAGTVAPNETLVLKAPMDGIAPDGIENDCTTHGLASPDCFYGVDGERIGANTYSVVGFNRATATIASYYDFKVDPGEADYDTVLNAQISGKGEFNGLLALIAGGQVSGKLKLKLYDLGESDATVPADPQLVHQDTLSSNELTGKVTTGIGFSITVEGGAPYIGVGGSPSLGFNIQLQKKVVRDGVNFGFGTLVRRGHSYRVMFEVESEARRGATNGVSISQFRLGDDLINLLDPQHWRNTLTGTLNPGLPSLKADAVQLKDGGLLQWGDRRMFAPEFYNPASGSFEPLADTNAILGRTPGNFPRSFGQIIDKKFGVVAAAQELIDSPGFTLHELSVTLEADTVAMLEDQTMRINEAIRLLLLPHGQRSTDLLDCSGPGNSGSHGNNGNANGNGNSGDCRFPGFNASTSTSSGTPAGSSADASGNNATLAANATDATTAGAGAFGLLTLLAGLGLLAFRVRGATGL